MSDRESGRWTVRPGQAPVRAAEGGAECAQHRAQGEPPEERGIETGADRGRKSGPALREGAEALGIARSERCLLRVRPALELLLAGDGFGTRGEGLGVDELDGAALHGPGCGSAVVVRSDTIDQILTRSDVDGAVGAAQEVGVEQRSSPRNEVPVLSEPLAMTRARRSGVNDSDRRVRKGGRRRPDARTPEAVPGRGGAARRLLAVSPLLPVAQTRRSGTATPTRERSSADSGTPGVPAAPRPRRPRPNRIGTPP